MLRRSYFRYSLVLFFLLFQTIPVFSNVEIESEKKDKQLTYKNPTLSGLFSLVIPGTGHMYQGMWKKGLLFTSTEGLLLWSALSTQNEMTGNNLLNIFQNEHFYNVYSAYQDARIGNKNKGRMTEISDQSLVDLLTAPFDFDILSRWTYLLPTSIALGIVTYSAVKAKKGHRTSNRPIKYWGPPLIASQSTLIGVGEESLFRGFLQPEFTELFKNEWAGIFTQAALFGLAHYPGSVLPSREKWFPVIFAGLFGIYDGWIAKRNKYNLRENVAGHMWWDTLIFSGSYLIDRDGSPFIVSFSLPFL